MNRNINFNGKQEYLEYRKQWKADYKALSHAIREQKMTIRSQHTPSWSDYSELRKLKITATCMLEELKLSKQEAQNQYLKNKQKEELVTI